MIDVIEIVDVMIVEIGIGIEIDGTVREVQVEIAIDVDAARPVTAENEESPPKTPRNHDP